MLGHLKSKLKASSNFPSPPAVAQQIIALARDPNTDISQVAAAIGRDPALAAKLLRVANSALYSRQRKSTNLRQALIVLGLEGATTLALGFSLAGTYMGLKSNGVDYDRYWRRSILSASAARCFGALQKASAIDDIFLAALLQDIAILGIDRTAPEFYRDLPRGASRREFSEYETVRLGIDHAELGAWLLEYWKMPEALCRTVGWSHAPPAADCSTPAGASARCIALGNECVEMLLGTPSAADFSALTDHASEWLGIDAPAVAEVMSKIVTEIPEIERLFDTKLLPPDAASGILEQARELLVLRNLQALDQVSSLREANLKEEARPATPPDARRDRITGVYNRGYLDLLLRREFQAANSGGWPLSLVLVNLDDGKAVDEAAGRDEGDSILAAVATSIASVARDTDCVARYGSTAFVIVLPGVARAGAEILRERLIDRLRRTTHTAGGTVVGVRLGIATHTPDKPLPCVSDLIGAAERAALLAKQSARNRPAQHGSSGPVSLAKTR